MGETSPVGVQSAGIPAPLAFLRGVLCLNSELPADRALLEAAGLRLRAAPLRRGARAVLGPAARPPPRRRHDRHDRAPGDGAGPRRRGRRDALRTCPSTSPSSASRACPTRRIGVSYAKQAELDAISEKIAWSNPRVVVLRPVPAPRRPARGRRRLPDRARDLRRGREAVLRRLPPAAGRDAHPQRRLLLGHRAAGRRPRPGTRQRAERGQRHDRDDRLREAPATGPTTVVMQYSGDGGRSGARSRRVHTERDRRLECERELRVAPAVAHQVGLARGRHLLRRGDPRLHGQRQDRLLIGARACAGARRAAGERARWPCARIPTGAGAYP